MLYVCTLISAITMKFFTIIYSILLSLTVIPIVIHSFISKLPPIQFIKTTLLQLKNNNQLDKTNSNTYINTNSNSNSNTNSKNNSNNYTYSNTRKKQICVLGGGFGGLYTALKINSLIDTKTTNIILVDPKDRFVFLPLLYELAVGTASSVEVAPRYNDLLKRTKINFVQGSVSTVNFDEKSFLVNKVNENNEAIIEQSTITFDELVIAVGIQPRVDIIPGASKHALPFSRIDDAYKLKYKLKELKESVRGFIRVAVIGGGYSGVEVAANIAQTLGINKAAVTIIDRNKKIMSTSPPHNRETSERSLKDCGVNILQNTNVKEVKANGLTLIDETGTDYEFPADLVIVTAGTSQSQFVKDLPLTKDANGRILTSDTLQSMDYPFVFAMGDCASIDGYRLPSTAQVAMQQADIVGKNVVDYLKMPTIESSGNNTQATTNDLKKFRFLNLGEMLTLGDTNAAITSLGGLVELSGPLAAIGRRAIYAYRMPTSRQMVKALVTASATTTGKILGSIFNKNK